MIYIKEIGFQNKKLKIICYDIYTNLFLSIRNVRYITYILYTWFFIEKNDKEELISLYMPSKHTDTIPKVLPAKKKTKMKETIPDKAQSRRPYSDSRILLARLLKEDEHDGLDKW